MSKYIDADALMKYLDELRSDATEPHLAPQAAASPALERLIAYDDCKRIVERMPAADVERVRHGEWTKMFYEDFKCSRCAQRYRKNYNYCPHCGAKMDGDSE